MSEALRGFFLIFIFALIMIIQYNLDADKTATRQLKNTLELAIHDASLAIDENQISQGFVVFDQGQAEINFKESMMYHLRLDSNYVPVANSFYQNAFKIKVLEFIDDQTPDPNNPGQNITFPYVYTNSTYDIVDVLNGPSIIAVVETISPRYFTGNGNTIRQAAIYEYVE
ncbi:peptidase M23 [Alkalihalobacillus sp. BA299]|uniref:peptidase M23 n=1 Tax=Alkalihalobacillus sp. BA299 TaxID=2815938 RepID=UPI0027DAD456|nr:peptidase M23 [Alkalihalobacillus sp. BA299]